MSVMEKLIDEICDAIETYKTKNYKDPKYLVLPLEYRQAIKLALGHSDITTFHGMIKTFYGIEVVSAEDAIILSTKPREVNSEKLTSGG